MKLRSQKQPAESTDDVPILLRHWLQFRLFYSNDNDESIRFNICDVGNDFVLWLSFGTRGGANVETRTNRRQLNFFEP